MEAGAFARFGFDCDRAKVRFGNEAGDGKPQAGACVAALAGMFRTIIAFKDVWEVVRVYARPGVAHTEHGPIVLFAIGGAGKLRGRA